VQRIVALGPDERPRITTPDDVVNLVGVEMAAAWASLGSRVSVVEAQHQLLPREGPFAGDEPARGALRLAERALR